MSLYRFDLFTIYEERVYENHDGSIQQQHQQQQQQLKKVLRDDNEINNFFRFGMEERERINKKYQSLDNLFIILKKQKQKNMGFAIRIMRKGSFPNPQYTCRGICAEN